MGKIIAEGFVAGVVAAPFMFINILIFNMIARTMHQWGWLDLSWLKPALGL